MKSSGHPLSDGHCALLICQLRRGVLRGVLSALKWTQKMRSALPEPKGHLYLMNIIIPFIRYQTTNLNVKTQNRTLENYRHLLSLERESREQQGKMQLVWTTRQGW